MTINPDWKALLEHTVGAESTSKKSQRGYRNHFCTEIGSNDYLAFVAMVDNGLASEGSKLNQCSSQYFHATLKGCKAINLHKAAIARAFAP